MLLVGNMDRVRILFVQHARNPGGSNVSLLYTLQALDRDRYDPVVGLVFPSAHLRQFYECAGFVVVDVSKISVFRHTTGGWGRLGYLRSMRDVIRSVLLWNSGGPPIVEYFSQHNLDLVHLNSVILAPAASALMKAGVPFVWHVREYPVHGYFGFRYRFLRHLLQKAGNKVIFLSNAEKRAWVGDSNGTVINNFIDFRKFDTTASQFLKENLPEVDAGHPVILYLGGFSKIKGIFPLLDAVALLKKHGVPFRCLFPGTLLPDSFNRGKFKNVARQILQRFGIRGEWDRCEWKIQKLGLQDVIVRMPFSTNVPGLLSVSDCLVFPSVEPHFARPVIEAQVMRVPVVASRIDGVTELVEGSGAGYLVEPSDVVGLANAVRMALGEKTKVQNAALDEAKAYAVEAYDSRLQIKKIIKLYEQILPSSAIS